MDPDPVPLYAIAAEVATVAFAAIVGFVAVAWILARAAKQTPQAMVAIILGLLTILALVGYLVTREEIAANLVATGIGAFAGALTALFKSDTTPPSVESQFDADAYKQAWREHWESTLRSETPPPEGDAGDDEQPRAN